MHGHSVGARVDDVSMMILIQSTIFLDIALWLKSPCHVLLESKRISSVTL